MCKSCRRCNTLCKDFTPRSYHCPKLDKAPFVCNACPKKAHCRFDKAYYKAITAHKEYRSVLVESRTGINISPQDLAWLDELISPLILRGQSPYCLLYTSQQQAAYDAGLQEYQNGVDQLTATENTLAETKKSLDQGRQELESREKQLEDARTEGQNQLDDAKEELEQGEQELACLLYTSRCV